MANIARADDRFHTDLRALGVSDAGVDFIRNAVDPFHDAELKSVPMPDGTVGKVNIARIREKITMTKPASLPAGNWDFHLAVLPFETSGLNVMHPYATVAPGKLRASSTGTFTWSTSVISICCVPAGSETFRSFATDAVYVTIPLDKYFPADSAFRLTSLAVEIHDRSPEIEQRGSLTSYRQEQVLTKQVRRFEASAGTFMGYFQTVLAQLPPENQEDAMLLMSETRPAKEGALIPVPLDFANNDFQYGSYDFVAYTQADQEGSDPAFSSYDPAGATSPALTKTFILRSDMVGAFVTGNGEQNVYDIYVRGTVEQLPYWDSASLPLAMPATQRDDRALEMAYRLLAGTLSSYPVADNSAGDFFRSVARVATRIAKPVLDVIRPALPPRAQAALAGAEAVIRGAKQISRAAKGGKAKGKK